MAVAQPPVKSALGENLRRARRAADLTQEQAAERLGVTKQTISDQERGAATPNEKNLSALANLYGTTEAALRYGDGMVREATTDYTPNPTLKNRLRPKPRARVYQHIQTMVDAGCSVEQIDEAERLMTDAAYNKINTRDIRDRSDDEMIVDIDDAWDWIREVLGRAGVKDL